LIIAFKLWLIVAMREVRLVVAVAELWLVVAMGELWFIAERVAVGVELW
jgi:hypothetical protein